MRNSGTITWTSTGSSTGTNWIDYTEYMFYESYRRQQEYNWITSYGKTSYSHSPTKEDSLKSNTKLLKII